MFPIRHLREAYEDWNKFGGQLRHLIALCLFLELYLVLLVSVVLYACTCTAVILIFHR